jgi:hypothetical protein
MARLTAPALDGVGPISPGPRSAWGEFREDPVLFARSRPQVLLIPLVFVVFVGIWEWVVRAWSIPAFLVPAPSMVASALSRGVRSGLYLANFWATLYEALMGFVIAAVSGIMLGAVIASSLRGLPNDVYFTVGLTTIIGLAAKDAILIIEFAKDLRARGKSLRDATVEACFLRFRPILMTGLAFACGVAPMIVASGASGKSQQALGTGVLGGMIAVVVLALVMVPVFFVTVQRELGGDRERPQAPAIAETEASAEVEATMEPSA